MVDHTELLILVKMIPTIFLIESQGIKFKTNANLIKLNACICALINLFCVTCVSNGRIITCIL